MWFIRFLTYIYNISSIYSTQTVEWHYHTSNTTQCFVKHSLEFHLFDLFWLTDGIISMGQCKKDVTSLLAHWSYIFLALTHWYILVIIGSGNDLLPSATKPLTELVMTYQQWNHQENICILFHWICWWLSTRLSHYVKKNSHNTQFTILFLPEASFGLRVLSLPACVCVCPCVRQSWVCPCDNSSTI